MKMGSVSNEIPYATLYYKKHKTGPIRQPMLHQPNNRPFILLCNDNVVSIYPFLPILGLVSGITTFAFCLGLVLYPYHYNYQGSLTYISEGMDLYCGWSGAVLGSCGMFIAFCEMAAALHTNSVSLLVAIFVQAPCWCILVGVSGTGWGIHYTALVLFLFSTLYFHCIFAWAHPMGRANAFYQKANAVAILNALLFCVAFSSITGSRVGLDVTVSLEVSLLCWVSVQTLCVSWVLLQYHNIHILFEEAPKPVL
jgi:hypothetical protein